jgi:hypothetical protein
VQGTGLEPDAAYRAGHVTDRQCLAIQHDGCAIGERRRIRQSGQALGDPDGMIVQQGHSGGPAGAQGERHDDLTLSPVNESDQ